MNKETMMTLLTTASMLFYEAGYGIDYYCRGELYEQYSNDLKSYLYDSDKFKNYGNVMFNGRGCANKQEIELGFFEKGNTSYAIWLCDQDDLIRVKEFVYAKAEYDTRNGKVCGYIANSFNLTLKELRDFIFYNDFSDYRNRMLTEG